MLLRRNTFNIRRQVKSKRMEIKKHIKLLSHQKRNPNVAMLKSQEKRG